MSRPVLRAVEAARPRIVAYIRVSRERDEMISPELQERAIRDYCDRMGYDLVLILTDLDLTGRFWKRRQVERAIAMIESGEADGLVVWKISRVARNRLDWNIALDRVESIGGRLESATEPIDATTSSGRFSRGVLAELAAFESERIGEGWHEAHAQRWRSGLPHSGRPRFGYTYERAAGYTIDPVTGPLVRGMYERYLAGETPTAIARWLAPMNLGNMRTHRSVQDFMDSGFAAGWISHHDPDCTLPHPRDRRTRCKNIVRSEAAHEPIITRETFDAYLTARAKRGEVPVRSRAPKHTASGIIICTACGWKYSHTLGRRSKDGRGSDSPAYRCNRTDCPNRGNVAESRIDAAILAWLPRVADLVNTAAAQTKLGAATDAVEKARLERVAIDAAKALTQLTVDKARGLITDEASFIAARDMLTREHQEADAAAKRIETAVDDARERGRVAADLLAAWPDMLPLERNRVLRELCVIHATRRDLREVDILVYDVREAPDIPVLARP